MNLFRLFIILTPKLYFLRAAYCDWTDLIENQITQKLKPYQVAAFVSNTMTKNSSLLQVPTIRDYPTMILPFGNTTLMTEQISQWGTFTQHTIMQKSLIIFYTNNPGESISFIDFLIKFLSVRARPKCLIISFGDTFVEEIENILRYAWERKFLDFTIFKMMDSNQNSTAPLIYEYNPFFNRVNHKYLDEMTHIFPEKLQNLNEYPIRLSKIIDFYGTVLIRYRGKPIKKYDPTNERLIDFILSTMNFTVIKKLGKIESFSDMLYNWNSNMFCLPTSGSAYVTNFIIPINEETSAGYAYVPILPTESLTTFSTVFYNMIIVTVVILILIYVTSVLGISTDNLGAFSIVRMILGQSVSREPRKIASTIIYLIAVVAYIKLISFDFYDNIVGVTFESAEIPFESFEDLNKSNFDVYTSEPFINQRIPDDPHLKYMMQRKNYVYNINNCFDRLITSKNVICIAHELYSYEITGINKKYDYPAIKIAKPIIYKEGMKFYEFEKSSPFGDKFAKMLQRIQETSLDYLESLTQRFDYTIEYEEPEINFDDGIDVRQLLLVLCCGYFLAILTFFAEFIVFKLSPKPPIRYLKYGFLNFKNYYNFL